jgi:hypothetical protein
MPLGVFVRSRVRIALLLLTCAVLVGCSGGVFKKDYEYEEELYLALDGSATLNVNASVASLVALRGADLDPDPLARIDRNRVRALFEGEGASVSVSLSRRHGRRFVHASVDVDDVARLSRLAPFAWSAYRFNRAGEAFEFRQVVGPSAGKAVSDVGWTGGEEIVFRMHLPSEILEWEQPLVDRLAGAPIDIRVQLEPKSILYTTLLLFGSTILAAAAAFALVVWWISRRGRDGELAET